MVGKCANSWCPTTRHHHEGKLFRVDIDLGNMAGENEQKTAYLWLCAKCAEEMAPKIEVVGDTVTVRLSRNVPMRVAESGAVSAWVN
jgi:hypothetical protein